MKRLSRVPVALGAISVLLVLVASPALAETSLSVAAPGEATVGDTVPVIVTVTEDGAPVAGAIVVLSRESTFAGISGSLEVGRVTTDEAGVADLSYVQRAAEETTTWRVHVVDSDAFGTVNIIG